MLRATARLLRPLVRALIRSGVTFPILADLLRTLYVDVAAEEIADDRARTDSRISLLTGIHRKELRRQRAEADEAPEPEVVTLNSRLIGRWLGDPAYRMEDGMPCSLPRSGSAPSFDTLVTSVTTDVHPRSILDDWLSQGIVTTEVDGRVTLRATAFLPQQGSEARLHYFSRNLHDHVAAAVSNVLGATPPFLERSVHYDALSPAAAAALETSSRRAAERVLLEVNRTALAIADADTPDRKRRRVNFGLYVYAEDEADAE